jgi:NTP pyrophosphatase (non-canonical NTP hydrolase)
MKNLENENTVSTGNLNQLRDDSHAYALKQGFYDSLKHTVSQAAWQAFVAQTVVLIHAELSELIEAHRKNRNADLDAFEKDCPKIGFKAAFEKNIKDTIADEIADVLLRTFDFAGLMGIDIDEHVRLKMEYNNNYREHKHGRAY